MNERPTFGSLFAGIGGIDLGLERAGWRGRWQVEYEPFCQRVLAHHWPDVQRYGDIKDVDWSGVERVDLVAGGFPCQPVSYAGRGLAQDDVRWLWPEFERSIRALRPRYVLVENVPGLLRRGFDDVLSGLAALGYDAEWDCIPAAAVGAPHLRDRVWVVAYADGIRPGRATALGLTGLRPGEASPKPDGAGAGALAYSDCAGRALVSRFTEGSERAGNGASSGGGGTNCSLADPTSLGRPRSGQPLEPEHSAACRDGQAGEPWDGGWWRTEPDVGRVAHGVPARVDRLRALGNAVVPQVVEFIGRRILEAEALT